MYSSFSKSTRLIALALVTGFALAGCATRNAATETPELSQRIQTASSKADHEAIALAYLNKAAAARVEANEHRRMAALYRAQPASGRGGNMNFHCENLVKKYEGIAQDYETLAAEHRQLRDQSAR